MKKLLNTLFSTLAVLAILALCRSAWAQLPPYGLQIYQVEPGGTFFYGRYMTPADPGTSYLLMYDGPSSLPKTATIGSGLSYSSGTLSASFNGAYSSLTGLPPARSFSYLTRSLNTCFQISASRDASVSYSVDIAASLSLAAGQVGTVYLRVYTNSACTSGAQELMRFANENTGTLTVGLATTQNVTAALNGIVPAGMWVQLVTENTTGTPTFTARPGQEVLL